MSPVDLLPMSDTEVRDHEALNNHKKTIIPQSLTVLENDPIFSSIARDVSSCETVNEARKLLETFFALMDSFITNEDCFADGSRYTSALQIANNLRTIIIKNDPDSSELGRIDSKLCNYCQLWAESFLPRYLPKPCSYDQTHPFSYSHEIQRCWIALLPLFNEIPSAEPLCILGNGRFLSSCLSFIHDQIVSKISRVWDAYCITKRMESLIDGVMRVVDFGGRRLRQLHMASRITRSRVATRSQLKSKNSEDLSAFENFLVKSGHFCLVSSSDYYRRYEHTILLSNPRMRMTIENDGVSHSPEFNDAMIIEINSDTPQSTSIIIRSASPWHKNRWVSLISRKFDLQITNHGYTEIPELCHWITDIVSRFDILAICMFHALSNVMETKGFPERCPHFVLICYHYACHFMMENVFSSINVKTPFRTSLWHLVVYFCQRWIRKAIIFYDANLIKSLEVYISPALNVLSQVFTNCPIRDQLEFKQKKVLLRIVLERLHQRQPNSTEAQTPLAFIRFVEKSIDHDNTDRIVEAESFLSDLPGISHPQLIDRSPSGGRLYKCYDGIMNCVISLREICVHPSYTVTEALLDELVHIERLGHRSLIEFYEVIKCPFRHKIYLKLELCNGGTLRNHVHTHGPIRGVQFGRFVVQILLGVAYLHSNRCIHGDLRPDVILMTVFGSIKISGYGALSKVLELEMEKGVGKDFNKIEFIAPEVLFGQATMGSSDIWGLGCLFYFMATGLVPWFGCNAYFIMSSLSKGSIFDLSALNILPLDSGYKELIRMCLKIDPLDRPDVFCLLNQECLYDESINYDGRTI